MLKITTEEKTDNVTLKLEGRLAGPWVEELSRCWLERSCCSGLIVDMRSVTFIDPSGKALLANMSRRGARFIASDCLIRSVIAEIERAEI